ncbi:MAG: patatin-like phospholipase family protein [Burkholderiaceae bacterium]
MKVSLQLAGLLSFIAMTAGCASYGVIENLPISNTETAKATYSLETLVDRSNRNENSLLLAFSGGGTRAAALAYGVLQGLRDTPIVVNAQVERLLDEVDTISSVSGGSFTAAYYGLHGDGIFTDFEQTFLRRNVQASLLRGLFNPLEWFSSTGRTELAVQYYEDLVFRGATFADLLKRDGPMILINASDLGYGARFTFIQEYFDLLCSDLLSFPVSRAVTASSAVPLVFNPVVVKNHQGCRAKIPDWLIDLKRRTVDDDELQMAIHGLESLLEKDKRKYVHFVDGGITDNLGLRAIYDLVRLNGGPNAMLDRLGRSLPKRLILLSVNASTSPEPAMDKTNRQPSLAEAANAMSDVQLHRYNAATMNLMRKSLKQWAKEMSRPGLPVESYFIDLSFRSVKLEQDRSLLNLTPTSFSLTNEQVDRLIATGRELLISHPEFQRLLTDMKP